MAHCASFENNTQVCELLYDFFESYENIKVSLEQSSTQPKLETLTRGQCAHSRRFETTRSTWSTDVASKKTKIDSRDAFHTGIVDFSLTKRGQIKNEKWLRLLLVLEALVRIMWLRCIKISAMHQSYHHNLHQSCPSWLSASCQCCEHQCGMKKKKKQEKKVRVTRETLVPVWTSPSSVLFWGES